MFLADLGQLAVVEQDMGDVHVVLHGSGEVGEVLAETAVTGHRDDGPIRGRCPGAHGGGKTETDRAEISRHEHRLCGGLEIAAERVRVIAHIDCQHRIFGHQTVERMEDGSSGHPSMCGGGGPARLFGAPYRPALRELGALVD